MGEFAHRSALSDVELIPVSDRVRLRVEADLCGRFVRRYKRFLADIITDDGLELTVHCANPGSMKGFHVPGARVRCSTSDNPRRKLRHTLEMMQLGRTWVGLQTTRANALVALALKAGVPTELAGYREIRPEIPIEGGSRLDFRLRDHPQDPRTAYVEVKTVTMAEGATALFPDSVTTRGLRHLEALMDLHAKGHRAVMLFAVLRADCDGVEPADAIDPNYGAALRKAARSGVEILALGTRVTARAITIERMLPVRL